MTVRPIDANVAMKKIREYMEDFPNATTRLAACRAILSMLGDKNQIPTPTPPNEPLSIEQLQQMDGEPVYIVFLPDADGEKLQFWALVAVDEWGEVYLMNSIGGSSAYEEVWADIEAIYRRPPEGET